MEIGIKEQLEILEKTYDSLTNLEKIKKSHSLNNHNIRIQCEYMRSVGKVLSATILANAIKSLKKGENS